MQHFPEPQFNLSLSYCSHNNSEWGVKMKIKSAVGAALLVSVFHSPNSFAAGSGATDIAAPPAFFAKEFGDTLPPIGYVKFCAANPAECVSYSFSEKLASARIKMNPTRWNQLYQVNASVNRKIAPVTDQELYGVAENWTYPATAGDCEDYLLLKKRELEAMGFPPKALRITVVLQEKGEGHAVLTVTSNEGDYVLDNRRNEIMLWTDTNYTFLKRQADNDPRHWVSLLNKQGLAAAAVSSSRKP